MAEEVTWPVLYPISLSLSGARVVVAGGGSVAARKVERLAACGAAVAVVAPDASPEIEAWAREGRIALERRAFLPADLDGARLAMAATSSREANAAVAAAARDRGIWVNVADDPALCTFQLPAIADMHPVTVAVSTSGASPALARDLADGIADWLGPAAGERAAALGAARREARRSPREGSPARAAGRADRPAGVAAARPGTVHLVGAGPGHPGLITVAGLGLVETCDVLVYDNLLADELVAISGAAEKIHVGKAGGRHAMPQERINGILVEKAGSGRSVVRLKGGDPFVFGRGGEECLALRAAGIPFEIVPGVTAGIAGPAWAGIPVTHRDASRGVTLVTAHVSRDGSVDLPWKGLASLGHTIVFYMVVSAIRAVCERLSGAGMDPEAPAAVVEQATTGSQRVVRAALAGIAAAATAAGIRPPAVLVVGGTVDLAGSLAWVPTLPLAGRTVLWARDEGRDREATHRLRDMGAKVVDVPVPPAGARPADLAWIEVRLADGPPDAVVFGSGRCVPAVLSAAPSLLAISPPPAWACLGPEASRALLQSGLKPDVIPDIPDADLLVDALIPLLAI